MYVLFMTAFHLSEFFIAATYRKNEVCFDCSHCSCFYHLLAYLVNQSTAYEIALITGIVEYWIEYFYPPYVRLRSNHH